ncbi:MAG TPA: TIR domain-containing protein [Burkholderiales bacterium]|nr:TIR domain-containing protein [Burkholderiales bacterium]
MAPAGSSAPEGLAGSSSQARFDAFLSYSSADRSLVRRIQRFLESYRPPGRAQRLKVYLDETDMRGGSLPENLSAALADSRCLVVCWSDAAARSRWVRAETDEFRKLGKEQSIAIVHVAGAGPMLKDQAFSGIEPIEHDLRRGWRSWFLTPKGKLELLRLIAFLTGAEMRALRNWARRRALRNAAAPLALTALPVALLFVPLPAWDPVALRHRDEPITPIGCEVVDGKLWVVSWDEGVGEISGARAFFTAYPDALSGAGEPIVRPRTFRLPKRALPHDMATPALQKRFAAVLTEAGIDRSELAQRRDVRIAEPRRDHLLAILPQRHPEVDPQIAREAEKQGLPLPETDGSVVVVRQPGSAVKATQVNSLSPPLWNPRTEDRRLTPPARAISVAWQDNGEIWIGVAGERKTPGGLWHSADAGQTWRRVDGFSSVTSIDLRSAARAQTVVVAEQGIRQPRGTQLVSEPTRMMERTPDGAWTEIEAPPHDHDSEIEICGTVIDGLLYVRVGERLYGQGSRPLYRSVADVLGNRR